MIEIRDEDIRYAESIFLPEGKSFDSERISVIKCLESKDIQACPGSGKTTTLLAKLAIIAKKMPLKDNKGVCVLAHTNVAIDEIKNKLGTKSDVLFGYPNYFGTIQSFVDKFLAIPANIKYFNIRPSKIDNESYDFEIGKKCKKLSIGARGWLSNQIKNRDNLSYCDFLKEIRYDFVTQTFKDNNGQILLKNKETDTFKNIFSIKKELFENGILNYDDAYSLAFKYLNDFGEILRESFSERFAFVFIDEMQDTHSHQIKIIDEIFDKTKVIIQKFGDVNQSIYDNRVKTETIWEVSDDCLKINDSKRFSNVIANIVKPFCVNKQDFNGDSLIKDIQPIILQFDDDNIKFVLPAFAKIIDECNLDNNEHPFKAVGWVGVKKDKRTITSYFPEFQKKSQITKSNFDHLAEYLQKIDVKDANYYKKSIINILLKVLRLLDIKNETNSHYFSERSLIQYLHMNDSDFYDKLTLNMAEWCLKTHNNQDIFTEMKEFIENDFCPFFKITNLVAIVEFFKKDFSSNEGCQKFQHSNIYCDESNIDVEVATVHSVKGETHTATLYLETYYDKGFDIKRIINYLKERKNGSNYIQSLKMAYVGMSRPTHLLCVAAHKDTVSGNETFLLKMGWMIKNICDKEQPTKGMKSNYQSTLMSMI
ncbi:MAG: UvrD-helicase domain-containing protein [Candidatus Methanoperedens sp.]